MRINLLSNCVRGGIAAVALLAATPSWAANIEVKIANFVFSPQEVKVKAGDTVTWINEDDIPHTATSTTKAFNSGPLDTDDKFSFTFKTPGDFKYFCALHPKMVGSVTVEAK
jgi:plastocyanin